MSVFRENGRFGVYIFFAISGFLITSLLLDEWNRTGGINLRSFYIRRAFRILPPLLAVLAVFGVLGWLGVLPVPLGKWLSTLFFANNYAPFGGSWYLGHFWSLSIEEHFYLVWPAILFVLGPRRAVPACVGLIAAVAVWRFVDLSLEITADWTTIRFDDRTDTQADGLMWGCLLALLFLDPIARQWVARITAGWRYWVLLGLLIATQARNVEDPLPQSVQLALRPFLVVLLVVATVTAPTSRLGRTLERPSMRWLGRISYSLYLWQQLFLVWDGFEVDRLRRLQSFPVGVMCAIGCAVLSHRFIEQPAIRTGRRIAARHRSGAARER